MDASRGSGMAGCSLVDLGWSFCNAVPQRFMVSLQVSLVDIAAKQFGLGSGSARYGQPGSIPHTANLTNRYKQYPLPTVSVMHRCRYYRILQRHMVDIHDIPSLLSGSSHLAVGSQPTEPPPRKMMP